MNKPLFGAWLALIFLWIKLSDITITKSQSVGGWIGVIAIFIGIYLFAELCNSKVGAENPEYPETNVYAKPHRGSGPLLFVLLVVIISLLWRDAIFRPDYTAFSNDGPLGGLCSDMWADFRFNPLGEVVGRCIMRFAVITGLMLMLFFPWRKAWWMAWGITVLAQTALAFSFVLGWNSALAVYSAWMLASVATVGFILCYVILGDYNYNENSGSLS